MRAETPSAVRTASVMSVVASGNRQNNHSMVPADMVSTASSAATFARVDEDPVIPAYPRRNSKESLLQRIIHIALMDAYTTSQKI